MKQLASILLLSLALGCQAPESVKTLSTVENRILEAYVSSSKVALENQKLIISAGSQTPEEKAAALKQVDGVLEQGNSLLKIHPVLDKWIQTNSGLAEIKDFLLAIPPSELINLIRNR